jgi:transcriptional regulator with XRE-family HTH domain
MVKVATPILERHQKLFDEMLKRFDLSAKELAQNAEISEGMVSRFRQGRSDLTATKLIALLLAVPEEARMWYISGLFGQKPSLNLRELITSVSFKEQAEILRIISDIYMDASEVTDTLSLGKAV